MRDKILVIDCDPAIDAELRSRFAHAGLEMESSNDGLDAMNRLRENRYCAVVLDPIIRQHLNGFAVLSYIEQERPHVLDHLFLLTGMSKQTIQRTAPALVSRLFLKTSDAAMLVDTILAECAPAAMTRASGESLLLVEDDPATAITTGLLVTDRGYSVTYAATGAEALAALEREEFDVVMLDLIMPDVDGFAVLDHVKSTKPHLLRRVILTTGMPDKYIEGSAISGICGVAHKPIEICDLDRLLAACKREDVGAFEAGGESPVLS